MAARQIEASPLEGMGTDDSQTVASPTVKETAVPPAQGQSVKRDIEVGEAQEIVMPPDEEKDRGDHDDDENVDEDEIPAGTFPIVDDENVDEDVIPAGAIPMVDEDYEAALAANEDTIAHDFTGKGHELEEEGEEEDD